MILKRQNLIFVPQFFQEKPARLQQVLAHRLKGPGNEEDAKLARFYVHCSCEGGAGYYEQVIIEENAVEIFACGSCKKWSMSVTY